jgi:hypothetical protein
MSNVYYKPDFSESEPNLLKEWHPTKNGNLTPNNVPSNHVDKVWWICKNSHEWEATIQDRVKGERCPICVKKNAKDNYGEKENPSYQKKYMRDEGNISQRPYPSFQVDYPASGSTVEFRKHTRIKHLATAIIEEPVSGNSLYAQMQNFSFGGMYLETNAPLKKGETIKIRFNEPFSFTRKRTYPSVVKWCKGLEDEDEGYIYGYGLGVKFTW